MEVAERIRLIRIIEKATANPRYSGRLGILTETKRNPDKRGMAGIPVLEMKER